MKSNSIEINGENLSYFDSGKGQITLLFIHGAFISKEYWNEQLSHFSSNYRVITLDLAGHGKSSHNRADWTIQQYSKDINELIKELSLKNVILIGHSFGSDIMLETVTNNSSQIKGLIEVDHMKNVGVELPQETIDYLLDNLKNNFAETCEQYARQALITEQTDSKLSTKLVFDFTQMNPEVGRPLLKNTFSYTNREIQLLKGLTHKLHLLHVDYLPTNEESIKQYLGENYELRYMGGTCHYPMLENPKEFNTLLAKIISKIECN